MTIDHARVLVGQKAPQREKKRRLGSLIVWACIAAAVYFVLRDPEIWSSVHGVLPAPGEGK